MNTLKKISPALLALMALGACSSSVPASSPSAPAVSSPAPNERQVQFVCSNGETLSVRFLEREATAILTRHGTDIALTQRPSGSGFIYSNGPNTIRGKGSDLTVEIGRMLPLQCTAQ